MNNTENKQFIKLEMNKAYLITVKETRLNQYTCEVYGVTLLANTFIQMCSILDALDFMEVEVYNNEQT